MFLQDGSTCEKVFVRECACECMVLWDVHSVHDPSPLLSLKSVEIFSRCICEEGNHKTTRDMQRHVQAPDLAEPWTTLKRLCKSWPTHAPFSQTRIHSERRVGKKHAQAPSPSSLLLFCHGSLTADWLRSEGWLWVGVAWGCPGALLCVCFRLLVAELPHGSWMKHIKNTLWLLQNVTVDYGVFSTFTQVQAEFFLINKRLVTLWLLKHHF